MIPIVDTHMHCWDLSRGYDWLKESDPNLEKMLGDYTQLRRSFLPEDYRLIAEEAGVQQSVHIEAFACPDHPEKESAWLQAQSDAVGFPSVIVGYAQLDQDVCETQIRAHRRYSSLRGIRMTLNWHDEEFRRMCNRSGIMQEAQFRRGFALLEKYNLSFDLQIYDHQIDEAIELISDFPATTVILEHLGWPTDLSDSGFLDWKKRIKKMASLPNVMMKISGIGCVFQNNVSQERQVEYIRYAIESFSPSRCMLGSNFPPDGLFTTYKEAIQFSRNAIACFTNEDQEKICYKTAQRVYQMSG